MKKLLTITEISFIFAILYIFLGWHEYMFLHVLSLLLGLPGAIIFLFDILRSDVDEIPHGYLADIIRYIRKNIKKIFFLFVSFYIFLTSCSHKQEKQKKGRTDWRSVSIVFNVEGKDFQDTFVFLDEIDSEIKKIESYGDGTIFVSATIEKDVINPFQNKEEIKNSILSEIFYKKNSLWRKEKGALNSIKIFHKIDPNLSFFYTEAKNGITIKGKYEGKIHFSTEEMGEIIDIFEKI